MKVTYNWEIKNTNKTKFKVETDQNGEYIGWITFYAITVARRGYSNILVVDGYEMEFEETVSDPEEV